MNKIIQFKPFHELDRIRSQMSRLLDDSLSNYPGYEGSSYYGSGFIPPVDIYATADEVVMFFDLPGVTIQDVEVTATKDTLTISGELKPTTIPDGATCLNQERLNGKFKRSFHLPLPIQSEKVSASFKDGVLGIRLPKDEDIKGRTVKINVN